MNNFKNPIIILHDDISDKNKSIAIKYCNELYEIFKNIEFDDIDLIASNILTDDSTINAKIKDLGSINIAQCVNVDELYKIVAHKKMSEFNSSDMPYCKCMILYTESKPCDWIDEDVKNVVLITLSNLLIHDDNTFRSRESCYMEDTSTDTAVSSMIHNTLMILLEKGFKDFLKHNLTQNELLKYGIKDSAGSIDEKTITLQQAIDILNQSGIKYINLFNYYDEILEKDKSKETFCIEFNLLNPNTDNIGLAIKRVPRKKDTITISIDHDLAFKSLKEEKNISIIEESYYNILHTANQKITNGELFVKDHAKYAFSEEPIHNIAKIISMTENNIEIEPYDEYRSSLLDWVNTSNIKALPVIRWVSYKSMVSLNPTYVYEARELMSFIIITE